MCNKLQSNTIEQNWGLLKKSVRSKIHVIECKCYLIPSKSTERKRQIKNRTIPVRFEFFGGAILDPGCVSEMHMAGFGNYVAR